MFITLGNGSADLEELLTSCLSDTASSDNHDSGNISAQPEHTNADADRDQSTNEHSECQQTARSGEQNVFDEEHTKKEVLTTDEVEPSNFKEIAAPHIDICNQALMIALSTSLAQCADEDSNDGLDFLNFQPESVNHRKDKSELTPPTESDLHNNTEPTSNEIPAVTDADVPKTSASSAVWMPKAATDDPTKNPQIPYLELCAAALLDAPAGRLLLNDVYDWVTSHFPYFTDALCAWRNSIRHALCVNECFIKAAKAPAGRGFYWAIHPACEEDFRRGDFNRRQARKRVMQALREMEGEEEQPTRKRARPAPKRAAVHKVNPETNFSKAVEAAVTPLKRPSINPVANTPSVSPATPTVQSAHTSSIMEQAIRIPGVSFPTSSHTQVQTYEAPSAYRQYEVNHGPYSSTPVRGHHHQQYQPHQHSHHYNSPTHAYYTSSPYACGYNYNHSMTSPYSVGTSYGSWASYGYDQANQQHCNYGQSLASPSSDSGYESSFASQSVDGQAHYSGGLNSSYF